jgi:hypothetical protein
MWVPLHEASNEPNPFHERRLKGKWLTVEICGSGPWPSWTVCTQFKNQELFMVPDGDNHSRAVVAWLSDDSSEPTLLAIVNRFLSALVWKDGRPLWAGSFHPSRDYPTPIGVRGRDRMRQVTNCAPSFLFETDDVQQLLALALHREAVCANLVQYQYLAFYKIINIEHDKGKDQTKWIADNLSKVREDRAIQSLNAIRGRGEDDVAAYLYEDHRCAIAHSYQENQRLDPDDPGGLIRVREALPLVRALAWIVMTEDLGIKPWSDSFREDYERRRAL